MSVEVKIPAVGESISSGIVSVWHKKSGDFVNAGDALFTLETDKVSTEIVAENAGVLETKVDEGQEVKIGEVVATIDDSKSAPAESDSTEKKSAPEKAEAKAVAPGKETPTDDAPLSPAVRRIVEEEHVDPASVSGTGKGGRLTKGDVLAAAQNRKSVGDGVAVPGKPTASPTVTEAATQDRSASGGTDGRFTRKNVAAAPQDRRAARHGAAHRRDPHHFQRMRHERRAGIAREIAGRVHEKERRQARFHVVLHQSVDRSSESGAAD